MSGKDIHALRTSTLSLPVAIHRRSRVGVSSLGAVLELSELVPEAGPPVSQIALVFLIMPWSAQPRSRFCSQSSAPNTSSSSISGAIMVVPGASEVGASWICTAGSVGPIVVDWGYAMGCVRLGCVCDIDGGVEA